MLKDITIGQYLPGDSVVHKLDPRIKIISVIIYMISLFLIDDEWGYLSVALFTGLIIALSKLPLRYLLRGLRPLWFILVLTLGLHLFLNPGQAIFNIGPLTATREGLRIGVFMSFRLVFLILITSLLTLSTTPIRLTDGIERLLKPLQKFGLPAHELAMMMTIALRFIPTLLEEAEKIMKAQMARGADFESGNLIKRAKNMIPILVPLFISAFRRAEDLAVAMEARCYRGGEYRTRMISLVIRPRDLIALGVVLLFFGYTFVTRYYY